MSTSAFDLSVFDYAIWSLRNGGGGDVPFLGHSIFAHHFMPILALFAPLHGVFDSPTLLLVLQVLTTAAAGLLFVAFERRLGVERLSALLLLAVFLLSRRTHGAVAGSFYPESLQALLTFAIVLTWSGGRWPFWVCTILLLATKEDAAIYVAAFALTMFFVDKSARRRSSIAFVVASLWFVGALFVAIPASRHAEGLSTENPLLGGRYGSADGHVPWGVLAARLVGWTSAEHAAQLMATTGGLSILGPLWLVPAAPGLIVNFAAEPESMQASLTGHYAWPVLPWLFIAAAAGIVSIARRSRRLSIAWLSVLVVVTVADNPAIRRVLSTQAGSGGSGSPKSSGVGFLRSRRDRGGSGEPDSRICRVRPGCLPPGRQALSRPRGHRSCC